MERMEQEGGQLEESRRISMLAMEIKRVVKKLSLVGKYIGQSCFVVFQVLELWGLIFYFKNYTVLVSGCESYYIKFQFVVISGGYLQRIRYSSWDYTSTWTFTSYVAW
jgi:hypothetical protein